ncbi:O-antigen ligase family protein [uncultured Tenacibaculum sp.]|uniref:O-antigen ligase family protein n=1 Tax=uncultured Tenacibaculum sp. TaxID=174713 RepID=UPI002621466B|nr:O-antigen ligase family protein [uncultured Tenacibaculum sp.]
MRVNIPHIIFCVFITVFLTLLLKISPEVSKVYYPVIFVLFFLLIAKPVNFKINLIAFIFTLITGLSIFLNDIPTIFNSYNRWLGWLLILFVFGPLITTTPFIKFRIKAFSFLLKLLPFLTILSFLWYVFGLPNLGRGDFTGVTYHSMLLGPISGLSSAFFLNKNLFEGKSKKRLGLLLISLVVCVLAASRTALLAFVLVALVSFYIKYKMKNLLYLILLFCGFIIFQAVNMENVNQGSGIFESLSNKSFNNSREGYWTNRIKEWYKSPLIGVGFASVDLTISDLGVHEDGSIEPGTSWLAVLSMTGLLGLLSFILLLSNIYTKLYKLIKTNDILIINVLSFNIFFIVSFVSEGYLFAAGSVSGLIYWLSLGCASSLISVYAKKK